MTDCRKCKRIDVKCCPTCKRSGSNCGVWHKCGEDCVGYEARIVTNADRIRNMSDEELAEFIHKTKFDQGSNLFTCEEPPVNCHEECKECYMDWLQKEVE